MTCPNCNSGSIEVANARRVTGAGVPRGIIEVTKYCAHCNLTWESRLSNRLAPKPWGTAKKRSRRKR